MKHNSIKIAVAFFATILLFASCAAFFESPAGVKAGYGTFTIKLPFLATWAQNPVASMSGKAAHPAASKALLVADNATFTVMQGTTTISSWTVTAAAYVADLQNLASLTVTPPGANKNLVAGNYNLNVSIYNTVNSGTETVVSGSSSFTITSGGNVTVTVTCLPGTTGANALTPIPPTGLAAQTFGAPWTYSIAGAVTTHGAEKWYSFATSGANTAITLTPATGSNALPIFGVFDSTGAYVAHAFAAAPGQAAIVGFASTGFPSTCYIVAFDGAGTTLPTTNRSVDITIAAPANLTVGSPIFRPIDGTFTTAQSVAISSATDGASIYYTTGNVAATTAGTLYSGPISLSTPTTLRAIAVKDGMIDSAETGTWFAFLVPAATNLISNGDFSSGKNLWNLSLANGAAATYSVNDHCTVDISAIGTARSDLVLTSAQRLTIEKDQIYRLSFKAWAASPRIISTKLEEDGRDVNGDGDMWSGYSNPTWNLTTAATTFKTTFSISSPTDDRTRLRFQLGQATANVYIDDVVLEKVVSRAVTTTDVPDPVLRTIFEEVTGKSFAAITTADLLSITAIDRQNRGLVDLSGIELCEALTSLKIDRNPVTDISKLAGIQTLRTLGVRGCPIADLSQLLAISTLRDLRLSPADVSSIPWLTPVNFPMLKAFQLGTNYGLTYTSSLGDILTAFPLDGLGFNFDLTDSQFTDLYTRVLFPHKSTLRNFAAWADSSSMTNASADQLPSLEKLVLIGLSTSKITSLAFLSTMTTLNEVYLDGCNLLTDLTPLKTLYDNGGLRADADWSTVAVDVTRLNMDLRPATANRAVIDYLLLKSVPVVWQNGNTYE